MSFADRKTDLISDYTFFTQGKEVSDSARRVYNYYLFYVLEYISTAGLLIFFLRAILKSPH